ncbi:YfhO family protein [Enterococcus sp. BWB1-3]|uniref:YfhO family protein n=1 Tax=Enterococcus sp. BWB1-3 TaxID=2787713 RepID=UPI0019219E9D|nr:YfhO family protein [Enterococcus sp. BWB1-3]
MVVEEREKDGTVKLTVDSSENRMLVMNEYNDGNWRAFINGKETTVYKGNYLFRAIEVPAGKSEVIFKYSPKGLQLFTFVALGALFLLFLMIVFWKRIQIFINQFVSK